MRNKFALTPTMHVAELLEIQAEAILRVAAQLRPDQVEKVLSLLIDCQGKVVVIGVGKSGIISQKIAATFRSIGIVSVALHPCDALHGDLGVITADDVALLLSPSGESEDILRLIPHLKRRRVPLIAIVGNLNSSLARQADALLDTSIQREICPLNLAPTTSTTVALALGDTLAMVVMHLKQVTPELFAFNHPP